MFVDPFSFGHSVSASQLANCKPYGAEAKRGSGVHDRACRAGVLLPCQNA